MTSTLAPTTQTSIPVGSLIVTTGTSTDLDWWRDHEYPEGLRGIVQSYVPAEEADDHHAYYWVSLAGRFRAASVAAEHAKLAKTPNEVARAQLPTLDSIKEHLGSALLSDCDDFRVTETDRFEGERTVAVYGLTEEGLAFGVHVMIDEPFEID